jgi:ribosomal-protein-alanine N-acetyltransferase
MRLRNATVADLRRVIAIERASFGPDSYSLTTFLAHAFRDRKGFIVAQDDSGEVVGYVLVRLNLGWFGKRRGGITSIAVAAPHRRRGIGRALMREALRYLAEHRVEQADLEVDVDNRAAQSLYEAVGFRRAELLPHYYGYGRHGLRMIIDIPAEGGAAAGRGGRHALGPGGIGQAPSG